MRDTKIYAPFSVGSSTCLNRYVVMARPKKAGAIKKTGLTQSARNPEAMIVITVEGIETRVMRLNIISTSFSPVIRPLETKLLSQRTRYELYK